MKKYIAAFLMRGLMAAAGGPLVLAIVYGILGLCGTVDTLTVTEVVRGILSVTLMAFIAAGITVVYTAEALPLPLAILIHAGTLYLDYLIMYLCNNWISGGLVGFGVFSVIFALGFALVWLCIYLIERTKAEKLNRKLHRG